MDNVTCTFLHPSQLPLVIEPKDAALSFSELLLFLQQKRDFFKESLLKYGGILLRNFPIGNENDFSSAIQALGLGEFVQYIGGDSPRKKITAGVYTSTEAPPSFKIALHNELSYVKNYPRHIYFYCDVAPKQGGETMIADARKIYQAIDPEVKKRFNEKELLYISCYPYKSKLMSLVNKSHKSWVNVFETEDKAEVEKKCIENEILYRWNKNDWIQISQVRPAVIAHPQTREPVWFNQAHHFDFNPKFLGWKNYMGTKILYCRKHMLLHSIRFADDSKIARRDLYHILDVLEDHSIYFPWQKGDMLILDNVLAMHGRAAFSGKRRVLTAMTS
ncbi:MAG: TauD/TfdA family dioxygenase [Rhabdochlamydiaceae bacterium]|nr:TauD/TfdA family dioxygenase [Rhabdochlamydiaceae bacterium]